MRVGFVIGVLVFAGLTWQYLNQVTWQKPTKVEMVYAPVMEDMRYEKQHAAFAVNRIREAVGLGTLVNHEVLAQAAQNHAEYLVANHEKSHFETRGAKKFTGVAPVDRTMYTGYASRQVMENLSTSHNSGEDSVQGLFSAIYHRFGFLDLNIDSIGVGVAQDVAQSSNSAFVYVMGNSLLEGLCREKSFNGAGRYVYRVCLDQAHRIETGRFNRAKTSHMIQSPKIIRYPYDGEEEVPPAFYAEDPDPLPDLEVSGFPVSVAFNPYYFQSVEVDAFRLYKEGQKEAIETRMMGQKSDPHGRFSPQQFALFPLQRLAYNSKYRAEILYRSHGKKERLSWTFETVKIREPLYIIDQKSQRIHLSTDKSSVLYFKPLDGQDMLGKIRYPKDLSVTFLDNHTIRLSFFSENRDDFVIRAGEREVKVAVD